MTERSDLAECIEMCQECARACAAMIPYCLRQGGLHAELAHIQLLLDCTAVCTLAGGFLMRGSAQHSITCEACARICDCCAESCEKFAGDAEMRRCAGVCRECADSCRRMTAGAA
jgi:hypothetical protein